MGHNLFVLKLNFDSGLNCKLQFIGISVADCSLLTMSHVESSAEAIQY